MKKPSFKAQQAVQDILCDLPYTIRIDYSKDGQAGTMPDQYEAKVPGHFLDVAVKSALQKAWADGYLACMTNHTIHVTIDEKAIMKHVRQFVKERVRLAGKKNIRVY